ncbi:MULTISPECIES: UDP-N-acetylmuramoyl-L-alanyl-D-glutamate--2,6-diaminopimelate ligase [unclassified Solwaraspora]|uniref:UDP-N-acetylmuramoyl-L-alanyl-D-glutamate--2, 6-diaminopimelate ligase n=1 Tax=unclassified Solwaraspora TaxID=2627926 RepID=UPI00248BB6BE|nr:MULTISPECIES: UDP-N-acetylmuramoyl-L-alanyl-D-glutamate--2,6-diaminopimelate ligase [unclassified Solwaraspora]WBB94978.1 UDP-N-acetylmuramoyl-L-alanyl-D-glutamate--2,6-diaminopimelate ligase [Solwaraspora sp. WMMA2059]WBC21139.1 UDP-N-acetylmuramoyl-L-alanyl-D-glutamate--2,6-diaminopimelate ligase [Solwaraspora sp. WMMA2080]WJK36779.1 UDP-N-acetylmuramoyl-L-alanyl-D-glutamate--2,6-diaminopimelate ligase [Solwaraspora sp. WMMA2065]
MRSDRYAAARPRTADRVGSSAVPGNPRPRTNRPIPFAELAASLAVPPPTAAAPLISGITHASGDVRPGDLYAALPGARRHGAEFVADAGARGAVAVLTDPAGAPAAAEAGLPALVVPEPRAVLGRVAAVVYGEPTRDLAMVGLTGTAGKTSTAYLVESGLRAAGQSTGLIGTVETRLGDLIVPSVRTTPEATDLHAMLAVAREHGVASVVMEVSSHALALDRVGGVRFAVGGYTNFGSDHLDFHADAADYFAAKARLFDGRCAVEVLNHDDPALEPLRRPHTVTYSAAGDAAATWRAAAVSDDGYRQHFIALGPDGICLEAAVGLPGRHNVANALLAIATLVALGVDPATAVAAVADCPGVPGRLEQVAAPGPVLGVVDYAHKPDAIVAVLTALRGLADSRRGRLICVIGAGGDRDRGKRPTMGAAAARGADLVIVTDDNPRTEDPAAIRAEVRHGADGVAGAEVVEVAGRRAAIDEAVRLAGPTDVVALLGKGHEQGQEIDGDVQPFDDRVELAASLTARFPALVRQA